MHKDFRDLISNNTLKTDQLEITFYVEDIITLTKKHHSILDTQRNSKILYQEILKLEYNQYNIRGQSIWNQYLPQNPWNAIWKKTFYSYTWPEKNNILYMLLHYVTRTNDHMYRWTNPKHLKSKKYGLISKNTTKT